MGVKKELHPIVGKKRTHLPPACYTLTKKEKHPCCKTLANLKVLDGYSSKIQNLVLVKELWLIGLNSYDCHALMQ